MIDSGDFLAAKRRAESEVLIPVGPKIALSGGDSTDNKLIWAKLDQIRTKHPDMVLMHGGSPKGAEKIAARWADIRKVPQIAFKPEVFPTVAPFIMLNRMGLTVLLHPESGRPRDDHTLHATWMGEVLPLKTEVLRETDETAA